MTIPGVMSTFLCQSINSGGIQQFKWLVNGTRLKDLNQTERIRTSDLNQNIGFLNFNNIPVEYNGTTIQCIVTLTSGEVISSSNTELLVQGKQTVLFIDHVSQTNKMMYMLLLGQSNKPVFIVCGEQCVWGLIS